MMPPNLPPRSALLLILLLSMSTVCSAFPQPNLQTFQRNSAPAGLEDDLQDPWEVLYPSIFYQMPSGPDLGEDEPRMEPGFEWTPLSRSQMEKKLTEAWAGDWRRWRGQEKRNIVVADDAAFREKSKLLTAMERQKWLNSYMQKLLVVN